MSGGGGKRRPPRRPYYPNQRFRQYNEGAYNFSSDVNVDSQGGSFVYGGGPPPMQYSPRGGGRGYGGPPPQWGYGGGYPPQFGYRGPPRGFRPHGNYRGRFPRQGYGYGRGQYFPRQHGQRQRQAMQEGEDPYYHPSMFEDPWRYLLPRDESSYKETITEPQETVTEPRDSTEPNSAVADDGGDGKTSEEVREDRTVCVVDDKTSEVEEGTKVEDLKALFVVDTGGGGEECRNGEEERSLEGEGGADKSVEKESAKDVGLTREDEDTAVSSTVG